MHLLRCRLPAAPANPDGFTTATVLDASGTPWHFRDKHPIFSTEHRPGPSEGAIAVEVIARSRAPDGRELLTVRTTPWSVEADDGRNELTVFAEQVYEETS